MTKTELQIIGNLMRISQNDSYKRLSKKEKDVIQMAFDGKISGIIVQQVQFKGDELVRFDYIIKPEVWEEWMLSKKK